MPDKDQEFILRSDPSPEVVAHNFRKDPELLAAELHAEYKDTLERIAELQREMDQGKAREDAPEAMAALTRTLSVIETDMHTYRPIEHIPDQP